MIAKLVLAGTLSLFASRCRVDSPDFRPRPDDASGPLSVPEPSHYPSTLEQWLWLLGALVAIGAVLGLVNLLISFLPNRLADFLSRPFNSEAYHEALRKEAEDKADKT